MLDKTIVKTDEKLVIDTAPLVFSVKFQNYLKNMISIEKISEGNYYNIERLWNLSMTNCDISFIEITDKEDTISFININRIFKFYKSINSVIDKKTFTKYMNTEMSMYSFLPFIRNYKGVWNFGRNEMKIGKFIKKMLPTLTDQEIEVFVNKYKALYRSKINNKLKIVTGPDIKEWYDQDNYSHVKEGKEGLGQLGKSCMRYGKNYFDLYSKNTDVCSLLILQSPEDETKILGRALIWKLEDNTYYMDRIYTHFDSDIYIFRNYAKERGWSTHYDNIKLSNNKVKTFTVALKESDFRYYPYMDTFYVLSKKANKISSSGIPEATDMVSLRSTDGGYSRF